MVGALARPRIVERFRKHRNSLQQSVVSFQLLDEGGEHALDPGDLVIQSLILCCFEVVQVVSEQQVILQFAGRTHGDLAKPR